MDIWVLVIALLAIAIVLLIASMFAKDNQNFEGQFDEFQIQQSKEFYNIKTRLAEVEEELREPAPLVYSNSETTTETTEQDQIVEPAEVDVNELDISDLTKEEVIRLYSQGFTMQEIAEDVAVNINTVQTIVDDYIENR